MSTAKPNIAFIGIGLMGLPMATLLLKGEWQVIWGDLATPENFDEKYLDEYFTLPNNWNDAKQPYMNGAFGVATFRLKLDIAPHEDDLSILVVSPNSAWNLYLDGKLLANNGVVSADIDKFETHYIPRTLTAHGGESELILQVANFSNAFGGAEYAMEVWDAAELKQFHDLMSLFFALALGVLFSIGLFHMVFYLADKKHQEQGPVHLWFSLLCFILVVRVFGVIPYFHQYTPDFVYWSSLLLPYFTLYAAPAVYLLFFRAAFGEQFPIRLTLLIIWVCLFLAAATLVVPEYYYTLTKNYAISLNVFVIIYSIIFTIKAIMHKQAGAIAILVSNFIFFLTAVNDAYLYIYNGNGFDMTPFGIVILSLGYSYALLLRLQNTFHLARDTSKAFETLNIELEQQVVDRTKAFEAAAAKANNNAVEKAQFIAAASHDLRQPLHALSMFNFALKRQILSLAPQKPKITGLVEKQENAISNLSNLLQDTLDVSKTDSLKRKPKPTEIDVELLLEDILNGFDVRAKSQKIKLTSTVSAGQISSDASMLKRVLSNLVDNALKAARSYVGVNVKKDGANWVFRITDDGSGIAQADLNRIFDSYVSLNEQEPDEAGGYGLGLYVVNEFTQLLKGSVKISATSKQGSTFILTLPSLTQSNTPSVIMPNGNQFEAPSLHKKILAIDDEPEILDAMQNMLESWDCEILTASGLEEAQAHLKAGFRPDILIVDYHLHGVNGVSVIEQLRQEFDEKLAALIITGATQPAILEKIDNAGLSYLSKPIDAHGLSAHLHRIG